MSCPFPARHSINFRLFEPEIFKLNDQIQVMANKHYVAFPVSEPIFEEAMRLVEVVRNDEDKTQYASEVISVIRRAADEGLEYFFVQPMRDAEIGSLSLKAIEMGVNTGKRAVMVVCDKIIHSMNHKQIQVIMDFIESVFVVMEE